MLYSPASMEYFQTKTLRFTPRDPERAYFQIRGSVATLMEYISAVHADGSKPGKANAEWQGAGADWAEFRGQSRADALRTGSITAALEDFQKANATLTAPLIPGKMNYSPVGGAFNTGRYLAGHPVIMYNREKTKLPAKTINIIVRAGGDTKSSTIAKTLTKIARGAWDYQNRGGIVTLNVHSFHSFDAPQSHNGILHHGLIVTREIPLTSLNALATGASVQFYRGFSIPLAKYLSGKFDDGLYRPALEIPGYHLIQGERSDAAVLTALDIT